MCTPGFFTSGTRRRQGSEGRGASRPCVYRFAALPKSLKCSSMESYHLSAAVSSFWAMYCQISRRSRRARGETQKPVNGGESRATPALPLSALQREQGESRRVYIVPRPASKSASASSSEAISSARAPAGLLPSMRALPERRPPDSGIRRFRCPAGQQRLLLRRETDFHAFHPIIARNPPFQTFFSRSPSCRGYRHPDIL